MAPLSAYPLALIHKHYYRKERAGAGGIFTATAKEIAVVAVSRHTTPVDTQRRLLTWVELPLGA